MIIIYSILVFLVTYLFTKFSLPFLKIYFLDQPNKRSLHVKPTPKGGGIFFSISSSLFLLFLNNPLGLFCLPISVVGLIDDKYNISRKFRYLSQLLSVLILFIFSNGFFKSFYINNNYYQLLLLSFILILGTSIINFTNFMDGIDGLVAGCMIVWFLTISISENQSYFIIVSSLIGFIVWNWSPAKLFMGDAGSTFLGLIVVGAIFNLESILKIINSLLILTPIFFDSISCIFLRLSKKQNIFKPHKLHLYQRLSRGGFSKSKVSIIYISNTIILSFGYLSKSQNILYILCLLTVIFGIVLDRRKAYTFEN